MALVVNEDEISGAVSADVLPAIFIEIGDLKVCAVVRTAGSSIMHQKVFKKIYDQSNNGETYTDIKHIELDFTIDGHPITMAFTVLKDLYVDTILGCDFLSRFKVTLHFGLGLMKWKDQNEVIITEFVKTQEMFRAISGGSSACEHQSKASIEQLVDAQSSASTSRVIIPSVFIVNDNGSKSEKSHGKKTNKKKGKKGADEKNNSSSPVKSASNTGVLKVDSNKWVKVFVVDAHLISKYTAEHYGYYGILWGDEHENNRIDYEPLDDQDLTADGIHLIALKHIFLQALSDKIDYLYILSENDRVMEAMLAYQNKDAKKLAILKPGSCDEFYFEKEYQIYTEACKASDKIKAIKYEFVNDEKNMKEMSQLRGDIWEAFTFQALIDFQNECSSSEDSSFFDDHFCF